MATESVKSSRQGDKFHYRWAARRSLKLLDPNTTLERIEIEGSEDSGLDGEDVIDLTEYHKEGLFEKILYYQLKHSKRTDKGRNIPFRFSELSKTINGFSKRYGNQLLDSTEPKPNVKFAIVTNRRLEEKFRAGLHAVALGQCSDTKFVNKLIKATGLKDRHLSEFCSLLDIQDSEGDFQVQDKHLRIELNQMMASGVDQSDLAKLYEMISNKVTGETTNVIREEVLACLDTSQHQLFPAPPDWEPSLKLVERESYRQITEQIKASEQSVIVHAQGGVGKSVFTQQLAACVGEGSVVITYDCFGAGKYRTKSTARHQHRIGLVQMANELAVKGLTKLFIVKETTPESDILRKFLDVIKLAVDSIRGAYPKALLLLVVDAADNAEMAALHFGENSFASELLAENIPEGCKLVFLCRSERVKLLKPRRGTPRIQLERFSIEESKVHLRNYFPEASDSQAEEFHRLTSRNPRVQANALNFGAQTVQRLLSDLGPRVMTVEKQIKQQLVRAIEKIRFTLPEQHDQYVDDICKGLASLPPNIPLAIIAKVANVEEDTVYSFVTDFGRSLWVSDTVVHFRDEPTETWFRETFMSSEKDFAEYATSLEPLANTSGYVSMVLPQLYHEAGQYEKLVALALSEDYLPIDNPIDARNARIFRLQYALKSALKASNFKDASILAMRAGEESAGSDRQIGLLKKNVHLVAALRDPGDVYDLAMKRELHGSWNGSENIYSAALLSRISTYRGEALGHLRSAYNWLGIAFRKQNEKKNQEQREEVGDDDLLELGYAVLNLKGTEQCSKFFVSLQPKELIAPIFGNLIDRLVDQGEYAMIDKLMEDLKSQPLYILAGTSTLFKCGLFCDKKLVKPLLKKLELKPRKGPEPTLTYDDHSWTSRMDFAETAIYLQLPSAEILKFLDKNSRSTSTSSLTHSRSFNQVDHLMRTLAILARLTGSEPDVEKVLASDKPTKKGSYDQERTFANKKKIIQAILPWYILRLEVIGSGGILKLDALEACAKKSKEASASLYLYDDPIPGSIAYVYLEILKYAKETSKELLSNLYNVYIEDNKHLYANSLTFILRSAQRLEHLKPFQERLEHWTYRRISKVESGGPDKVAHAYANMACATLVGSEDNAALYFGKAVEILSKVGEERAYRWDAVVPLAKRAASGKSDQQELAYRFMHVAENIWEHAREKHWSRTDAMITSVQLSPGGGAAALSRWRDREIGDYEWMHHFMLRELVQSWGLDPLWAWSLTALTNSGDFHSALERFLEVRTISIDHKRIILIDGIDRLKKEGTQNSYWVELHKIAATQGLKNSRLESLVSESTKSVPKHKDDPYEQDKDYRPNLPWKEIFKGLDLLAEAGITKANNRLNAGANEKEIHIQRYMLWNELLPKIEARNAMVFLNEALRCDWMESYDMEALIQRLPESWLTRPAFRQKLPTLIKDIGSRFSMELTDGYRYSHMVKVLPEKEQANKWLEAGIIGGLAEKTEFADSEQLFGLARLSAPTLQPDEAAQVLDFALKRFEVHIDEDFGNGPWEDSLRTESSPEQAVTDYLWAALASPTAATRWRAAHVVVRLAEYGQVEAISKILKRAEDPQMGAFGYKDFPFYELNAKLYLIIACARIALEHPEILKPHSKEILSYVVSSNHAVIMKFAEECAKRLEAAFPGLYNENELITLSPMTQSVGTVTDEELKKQVDNVSPVDFDMDSYEEDEDDEEDSLFYFDQDFKNRWMIGVARAFNIALSEVITITSNVITKDWSTRLDTYKDDPRSEIWDKESKHDRTTVRWGFPEDDGYRFYLSYHALMTAAVKLLRSRPLIEREYNTWDEMLDGHITTRDDGYWISDWRNDVPGFNVRPKDESIDEWQNGISISSFIGAFSSHIPKGWITVAGKFKEEQDSRLETVQIESALVKSESSVALLNALASFKNYNQYKLPEYGDSKDDSKIGTFQLTGWINMVNHSGKIDSKDPFADELPIEPYRIGVDFTTLLGLVPADDGKSYVVKDKPFQKIIQAMQWASSRSTKEESPEQQGNLISCELTTLKVILSQLNMDLLLEVLIDRNYHSKYGTGREKTQPTHHHLFIICADGTVRDIEKSY